MKRRLRAYKKTVSIVNEKAIELYKGLGIEKKGFLLEGTDKESGQYTFMGVEPNEIIQSDKDSLVITRKDGSREVREGNPLIRLKEYFDEFEIVKDPGELDFIGGLVGSLGYDYIRYTEVLPDDNPAEIGIETIQLMLADKFIAINHTAETFTAVVLGEDSEEGRIKALKEAGFAGIYIDRRAYLAEQIEQLESDLTEATGTKPVISDNGCLSFYKF